MKRGMNPQVPSFQMPPNSGTFRDTDVTLEKFWVGKLKPMILEMVKFHRNKEWLRKVSQLFLEAQSHSGKSTKVNSTGAQCRTH